MAADTAKPFVIPLFIPHSGCPHRCSYCNQKTVTGAGQASPSSADIDRTIEDYLAFRGPNRGFTEVSFYGGNFLGLKAERIDRLLQAAASHVTAGKIDGIRFSTRPDTVDEERMRILARYPVSTIEIGVQSMDDRVLGEINRGHRAVDTVRAASRVAETGRRLGCQVMTGLPGEDEPSAMATAEAVAGLKPDFVRIYPLVVLAGSPLAARYRAGRFTPLDLESCIERVKKMYRVFADRRIPVIRMGLQPSVDLDAPGAVLAGPYHPALGHMVLASLMLDRARHLLDLKETLPESVVLRVHPSSISRMRGLKNRNIEALKAGYPGVRVFSVRPDRSVGIDDVVVYAPDSSAACLSTNR